MALLTPTEPDRSWKLEDITVTEPPIIRRAIGAAAIGNITEWYDFGVYAYLEPTIKDTFFSGLSDTLGTIATFGTLRGRLPGASRSAGCSSARSPTASAATRVLAITMIMMALGTFAIGCLPSESIGRVPGRRHPAAAVPAWCRDSRPAASTATR